MPGPLDRLAAAINSRKKTAAGTPAQTTRGEFRVAKVTSGSPLTVQFGSWTPVRANRIDPNIGNLPTVAYTAGNTVLCTIAGNQVFVHGKIS